MLLPIFLQTVNQYKTEVFGNDVNLTEINAKLEQLSKASIKPELTKEELAAIRKGLNEEAWMLIR